METIKRIDIREFRAKGYLQELNRRFLHPLGLALEVVLDEDTGEETLGGIWDYRDDPEGIRYDIANSSDERQRRFNAKRNMIETELLNRKAIREKALGYFIEPVVVPVENDNA